jgi:hypothetical protein
VLLGRSNFWTENQKWIKVANMKKPVFIAVLTTFGMLLGMTSTLRLAAQDSAAKPTGQLVLFADTAVFADPASPENKPEESAQVTVHITSGGKTYDLPALYRAVPHKNEKGMDMPIRPGMWTAKWAVPQDAATGVVKYSATATDKYGRTAEWTAKGGQPSWVTIVQ